MTHQAIHMADAIENAGYGLAGIFHAAMNDAAIRAAERRAAAGDAQSARALASALATAQAEIRRLRAELSTQTARTMRAEGALLRRHRTA